MSSRARRACRSRRRPRRLVVELGQDACRRTSLIGHRELAPCRPGARRRSRPGTSARPCAPRRPCAPSAAPRSRGSGARCRARSAGRGPCRPRRLVSPRASHVVHDDEVAGLRRRSSTVSRLRHPLAQLLELGVHASSSASGSRFGDLEALVVAELGGRAHADLEAELRAARRSAAGHPASRDVGIADGMDPAASSAPTYQRPSDARIASSRTTSRPSAG